MSTPFDASTGLIIVATRLVGPGGERIVRMALDTGATTTTVRTATLRQVGVGGLKFAGREALLIGKSDHREQGDGLLPGCWFSAIYVGRGGEVVRLEQ